MSELKIITLCGSTKFKQEFERLNRELTLQGHVVIMPACLWHEDGEEPSPEQRKTLDRVYDVKIRLANEILVINVGGYIGQSTAREIKYAAALSKPIKYLEAI